MTLLACLRIRHGAGALAVAAAFVCGVVLVLYIWQVPATFTWSNLVESAAGDGAAATGSAATTLLLLDWNALESRATATARCQRLQQTEPHDQAETNGSTTSPSGTAAGEAATTHWIVLTSINPPTLAVAKLAAQTGWRVVVVGDRKTPATWAHPNCVFLSLDAQRALGYRILAHVPERSYARKNIGYLYAVAHGAQVIYETDDDNLLTDPRLTLLAGSARTQRLVRAPSVDRHSVYNVYAHFGQPTVWPRGYPLDAIADGPGADPATAVLGPGADTVVGIEQGLADGDPDVDAIFRLTRKNREGPIDIAFARVASPLVLPPFTFSPFNSQNTVFHAPALWATLIPTTTTFRVCDIWRGYWAQRLLWEAGATLLFREPNVRQDRNVHDYHKDFLDELDLYKDAGRLVRFLRDWRAPPEAADHLFARVDALTIAMAREGFWAEGDVHLVRAWLQDLLDVCYVPPRPGAALAPAIPAFAAPTAVRGANHSTAVGSVAMVTTVLGCGNKCAMTPMVPKFLWEDVVFYTITFPGRHRMMRVVKHTWGRHLVRPLVVFTSGHDDPYVPTTFMPDPHPGWIERDRRQAVYVGEVVPLLLALEPPGKFFINVDDDTLPVLPNIHLWLADYKARNNGSYPYYVLHTVPLSFKEGTQDYNEQHEDARAAFTNVASHFPVGHMYGYSRDLLEELLPIYRTCPVLRPGDVNFGGLVVCSRVNMTQAEIAARDRRKEVPGFVGKLWMRVEQFQKNLPIDHPNASFYFHGIRPEGPALAAYQQIYGQHYGMADDPVAQRIVDGWEG